MDIVAATADAESLLRHVCPDLRGQAIYLLRPEMQADVFAGFGRNAVAWTAANLDRTMRPLLQKLGQWRGRGFAAYCHSPSFVSPEHLAGVCLHELGHWLSTPVDESEECDPGKEYIRTVLAFNSDIEVNDREHPPWHHHELPFLRSCCHLRRRAWQAGFDVSHLHYAGSDYGLSDVSWYVCAMRDEVCQRIGEPIRDILASPLPTELADLWRADTGIEAAS